MAKAAQWLKDLRSVVRRSNGPGWVLEDQLILQNPAGTIAASHDRAQILQPLSRLRHDPLLLLQVVRAWRS